MTCRCTPAMLTEHQGHAPGCMYHRPPAPPAPPEPAAALERREYASPLVARGELGPAAREGLVREHAWLLETVTTIQSDVTFDDPELEGELFRRLRFYLELEGLALHGEPFPPPEGLSGDTEPSGALENPKTDPPPPMPVAYEQGPHGSSVDGLAVGVLRAPELHGGTPWTTGSRPPIPPAAGMQDLAPGSVAGMRASQGPVMPTPPPAPKGFTRPPVRERPPGPEFSNGCAHPFARLQRYGGGSLCQDCGTEFPHYIVPV